MGERPVPPQGPSPSIEEVLQFKRDLPRGNVWNERFCGFPNIHNPSSFPIRYLPEELARASLPVRRAVETMGSGVMVEGWRNQDVRVTADDFILAVFADPTCELPWTIFRPSFSFVRPECKGEEMSGEFRIDPEFFDEVFRGTNHSAAVAWAVTNYYEWNQQIGLCSREERTIYQPGIVLVAIKLESLTAKLQGLKRRIKEEKNSVQAGKEAEKMLPVLLKNQRYTQSQIVDDPQRVR